MDTPMQNISSSPWRSRKRSSAWVEDEVPYVDETPPEPDFTPSKRLLSSRGEAIETNRVIRYNAQKLLNHIAFTRVYVTANFHNYNPNTSFIVLYTVSEQDEMYRTLCQMLPSLYNVSPSLQALAIASGYLNPNAMADQAPLRTLPLVTTAGMDEVVVEEFEAFRSELEGIGSCVAAVDHRGICVWSSTNDFEPSVPGAVEGLRDELVRVISRPGTSDTKMVDG